MQVVWILSLVVGCCLGKVVSETSLTARKKELKGSGNLIAWNIIKSAATPTLPKFLTQKKKKSTELDFLSDNVSRVQQQAAANVKKQQQEFQRKKAEAIKAYRDERVSGYKFTDEEVEAVVERVMAKGEQQEKISRIVDKVCQLQCPKNEIRDEDDCVCIARYKTTRLLPPDTDQVF